MPKHSLFRSEAVAFQHDALHAGDVLPVPPPAAALTWLITIMACAAIGFLATGSYARKQTVSGFLAPTLGVAKVFPPRPGVVISVDAAEGQAVEAGAPLLTVQVGESDEHGGDVDKAVMQALTRQRAAVQEQVALEQTKSQAEQARLRDRLSELASESAALKTQLAMQRARSEVAEEQVSAVRDLVSRGYISVVEYKRRQDNFLAQRQNEAALARQIAANEGEAGQQRHAQDELPGALAARLAVLRASVAALDERLAETSGRRAYQLRAPIAGRISALQARVGSLADPTIPQLAIVPAGSVLEAQLLVPAGAIGFVAPDQKVHIAYEAFPFQRFGLQDGTVRTVSGTLLRPSEVVGPVAVGAPSYRVTVALERQTIAAFGHDFPLGADMTLRADIVLDRRSLLEWVFEPVLSLHGRWS